MRFISVILASLCCLLMCSTQSNATSETFVYSFESDTPPSAWSAGPESVLKTSSKHFKDGTQSLEWTFSPRAKILVSDQSALNYAQTNQHGGLYAWVYNEQPVQDALTFQFGTADELKQQQPQYQFRFGLNFSGWRSFWISLEDDAKVAKTVSNKPLERMQILAPQASGTLYFDLVEFTTTESDVGWIRCADWQVPFVADSRDVGQEKYYHWSTKKAPAKPTKITKAEIAAFNAITQRYQHWVIGQDVDYTSQPVQIRYKNQLQYIENAYQQYNDLHLTRNGTTITGTPLFAMRDQHKPYFSDITQNILFPMALSYHLPGSQEQPNPYHQNPDTRNKILDILDHMHDQGWAAGSGLGGANHELLRVSAYVHAVYLMRDDLLASNKLQRELDTLEWFLTFGETYKQPEHPGASSDTIRTHMLLRLLYTLAMEDTPEKVMKMQCLNQWIENALMIAPRWGGTIKPDYTGFHHGAVYANAYAPNALHTASLVIYLLHDTPFAVSDTAHKNVKQALLTQRIMANKYDTPIAIGGRFPTFTAIMARMLPAYAYLALASDPVDPELTAAFKRLWDPSQRVLHKGLFSEAKAGIMYLSTLGSIQMMQQLAQTTGAPETAPQGHWTKPYAALAIQRRDNWLVSIKGFSKYFWDYEQSPQVDGKGGQNIFGRYMSYGAVQILGTGDPVNTLSSGYNMRGWDWNRWPGTTAIHLPLTELLHTKCSYGRHLSDETFVGGVSLETCNGLFAMKLHDLAHNDTFRANKSVFCFDNLIVCLGSDIANNDTQHRTETTLFQGWLRNTANPIWVNALEPVTTFPYQHTGKAGSPAWLIDTTGNGYYLPDGSNLNVYRLHQTMIGERSLPAEGDFASAIVDHGSNPKAGAYEYAILVQSSPTEIAAFTQQPTYEVLRKDSSAHIVKSTALNITGYALFKGDTTLKGTVITKTDKPCLVMTQETGTQLKLSVCDPDFGWTDKQYLKWMDIYDAFGESGIYQVQSKVSTIHIKVRGQWKLAPDQADVRIVKSTPAETVLACTCSDARTLEFILQQ